MKLKALLAISTAATVIASTGVAHAANSKGYNVGNFTLTPSVSVIERYDDNIYTEADQTNEDFITTFKARMRADAKGENKYDLLRFDFRASQDVYADDSDDNRLDYSAGVYGRLRLSDTITWKAKADYRRAHSNRGDSESDPTATAEEPSAYDVYDLNTEMRFKIDNVSVTPRIGMSIYDYKDYNRINGTEVDQDYRDHNEYVVGGRVAYRVRKGLEAFVDAEITPHDYDENTLDDRDSNGGTYLAGLRYRPSKDLLAEFGVGYIERRYDRDIYDDIHSAAFDGTLIWNYEEGSRVRFMTSRTISDTTSTNVGGRLATKARVDVSKKLNDALTAKAKASFSRIDYQGGLGATNGDHDRIDRIVNLGIGLSYDITENVELNADYNYGNRNTNLDGAEYNKNVVKVGLKYEF